MNPCPFCRMWEIPDERPDSWRALVDGITSFIPLNPVTPGHRLFVPFWHLDTASIHPRLTGRVFQAAAEHGRAQGEDYNLIVNAGHTATQTVFHLHVHYVPRHKDDGLALPWYPGKGNHGIH